VNDLRIEVVFADIKLDSSRINLKALKEKAANGIAHRKYTGVC
jgi:hypothetical protein